MQGETNGWQSVRWTGTCFSPGVPTPSLLNWIMLHGSVCYVKMGVGWGQPIVCQKHRLTGRSNNTSFTIKLFFYADSLLLKR